jgi:sugar lactone lactonase YvrE
MSDGSQGPGWWQASDLQWYPPELHADYGAPLPPPPKLPPPPTSATEPSARQRPNDLNLAATQRHPEALPSPGPADLPPSDTGTLPRQPWWRRQAIVMPAALLAVVVIGSAIGITRQQHQNSNGPQHREPAYGAQVTLPFTGLEFPQGVAVDTAGTVYITDGSLHRALKLPTGSNTQVDVPFTGLGENVGMAVDGAGNLYVINGNQVMTLAAGARTQNELPFTGLKNSSSGVAVDAAGNLYVTDYANSRVLKLAVGSSSPTVLPLPALMGPSGVAVDPAGNVYVTYDQYNRVVKLAAGAITPIELPFTGLAQPQGVAVDAAGNLYVADMNNNQVVTLAAGSATQSVLPFNGLKTPEGVAVDAAGNLYVADNGNKRVLKLPSGRGVGSSGGGAGSSNSSSAPAAASGTSSATAPPSGAKVTIDGQDQNIQGTSGCSTVSGAVYITIGQAVTVVMSDANPPVVQGVTLGTVDGVPLAFQPSNGLGSASATETGTTTNGTFYRITGEARGIGSPQMHQVGRSFEIDVTCP